MGLGSKQWLRLTKEAVAGTFDTAATVIHWIRLNEGNAFDMECEPQLVTIRSAEGRNKRRMRYAIRKKFTGKLTACLDPLQAIDLVPWGFTPVSDVLNTFTCDWFDGIEVRRSLGTFVNKSTLRSDSSSDNVYIDLSLQAIKDDASFTTFAEPALTVFPNKRCYVHWDSKGLVELGSTAGVVVTRYNSLQISVSNIIHAPFDEDVYISAFDLCGRDVDWTISQFKDGGTFRAFKEAQTALSAKIKWAVTVGTWGTAHSLTMDLKGANYVPQVATDRAFERSQYETLNLESFLDVSVPSDLDVTLT